MGSSNSRGYLFDLIKNNDREQAAKILDKHPEYISEPINDTKDTQGLLIASSFASNEIIKLFLEVK